MAHLRTKVCIKSFDNSLEAGQTRLAFCAQSHQSTLDLVQWNQNIDVKVRGLPSKYYGLYDGVFLEDEIEKLAKSIDEPPHPEWIPASSVQDTGETFGIINSNTAPTSTQTDDDADSNMDDDVLEMLAEEAANE